MLQELQQTGVDYTNINQAPADLMHGSRPDSTSPTIPHYIPTPLPPPPASAEGTPVRCRQKPDLYVPPSYANSIMSKANAAAAAAATNSVK